MQERPVPRIRLWSLTSSELFQLLCWRSQHPDYQDPVELLDWGVLNGGRGRMLQLKEQAAKKFAEFVL